MQLRARTLNDAEVVLYRGLLHDIYSSLNWEPPKKNPSNWRIETVGGRAQYFDNYDIVSKAFGVFADGQLVGGCRVLDPLHEKLEFENYYRIPTRFLVSNRVEINRFALLPQYLAGPAALTLWIAVLEELATRKGTPRVFISIFSQEFIKLCECLGFEFVDKSSFFKYFPDDPNECQLLYLDLGNKEKVEEIINRCRALTS